MFRTTHIQYSATLTSRDGFESHPLSGLLNLMKQLAPRAGVDHAFLLGGGSSYAGLLVEVRFRSLLCYI